MSRIGRKGRLKIKQNILDDLIRKKYYSNKQLLASHYQAIYVETLLVSL